MMTPLELKRLVRFGLAQMRAENAHHDFEILCTHVAKARISRNVIPATGPVGAGGDGGRDAETVPVLDEVENTAELGDFAGQVVVLCCTLQQKGVSNKIRKDVDSVL